MTDEPIEKTDITEAPRLMGKDEVETDQWMQSSQPLPESGYSSNSSSDQEQETNDNNNNETTAESEKSHDSFPTEKSIAKRKRVRYTATRIKYYPTRGKSEKFLEQYQLQQHQQGRIFQRKLYTGRFHLAS